MDNDNSNDDKSFINWQQKNNNNIENCVNNEKEDAKTTINKVRGVGNGEQQLAGRDNQPANDCCKETGKSEEENQGDALSTKSDSTENLSFFDLIDDIPLQDYVISDDEVSNPDNCVYAYRGSESPEPPRPQQPQDDETDFLEMDFDPEPNSEADGGSFMELNQRVPPQLIDNIADNSSKQVNVIHISRLNCISPLRLATEPTVAPELAQSHPNETAVQQSHNISASTSSADSENPIISSINNIVKATGTIPKRPSFHKIPSSSSLNVAMHAHSSQQNISSKVSSSSSSSSKSRSRGESVESQMQPPSIESCTSTLRLNCTNELKYRKYEEVLPFRNTEVERNLEQHNRVSNAASHGCVTSGREILADFDKNERIRQLAMINSKNSVNVYSVNCDEKTLIDALETLDLQPNINVIKQYFTDLSEYDTKSMDIPEYLLHISKMNSDYKRLMEVIEASCHDAIKSLRIDFIPYIDPRSNSVQISIKEILLRWKPTTNLRELSQIKNLNFNKMNVLGKIINILRQPKQRRSDSELDDFLFVPQYYRSGYICVTKLF